MRKRESMSSGDWQRGWQRDRDKQNSAVSREPDAGLSARALSSRPEWKSLNRPSYPGTSVFIFLT